MEVEIKPTEKAERLKENLEKKVEEARLEDGKLKVKTEDTELLERTPGIESFDVDGETFEGIKGKPVHKEAYTKLESKKDVVKALLATIKGYDLRILNTGRDWDLRKLKKYNPDIKHLKFDEPKEALDIDKSVNMGEESIEIDLEDKDVETVYRKMLT